MTIKNSTGFWTGNFSNTRNATVNNVFLVTERIFLVIPFSLPDFNYTSELFLPLFWWHFPLNHLFTTCHICAILKTGQILLAGMPVLLHATICWSGKRKFRHAYIASLCPRSTVCSDGLSHQIYGFALSMICNRDLTFYKKSLHISICTLVNVFMSY